MKNVFFFFTFCVKLKVQNTPTPKRAQVLEEIWRTKTKARLVVFSKAPDQSASTFGVWAVKQRLGFVESLYYVVLIFNPPLL